MNPTTSRAPLNRPEPELLGQTVVIIGGSAGIGLETARKSPRRGRRCHPHRPKSRAPSARCARLGALSTAAFDANDPDALKGFFDGLRGR